MVERCPVVFMIARSGAPAAAALVARPARRLCPETRAGSIPIRSASPLPIRLTALSLRSDGLTRSARSARQGGITVLLDHTTSSETADLIVQDGFRDGRDHYMTKLEHSGVWLSDEPLDEQDGGATGDAIVVEITEEVVRPYEWVETSSTSTLGR